MFVGSAQSIERKSDWQGPSATERPREHDLLLGARAARRDWGRD
jgi:hypothetical protein